ncbi:MAG TPA: tRNA (adenine-N1)-methyltransferase [Acidimicrobiia bacterium]|nr:tRNA (adenine-N1)-methyltransferase [Acidimicrobiia bacterium]
MTSPLQEGETVLLIDGKGRRYLIKLTGNGQFHYHLGVVEHQVIMSAGVGATVSSSGGGSLLVVRPRLADYVLKMPRGAQLVYPKDMGPIAVYADIGPGMTVLEAGTGSGALTLALLRWVGPTGRVISVERRQDHALVAERTVVRWLGEIPANLELRQGTVEEVIPELAPERIVLDLPEPWHAVTLAATHQEPGGIVCAYLPTVPQVQTTVDAMEERGAFAEIEVSETLHRTWSVSGRSVRPDHRMVAHTGFLVVGRRIHPRR